MELENKFFEIQKEEMKLRVKILHAEQQRLRGESKPFEMAMAEVMNGFVYDE